MGSKSLRTRIRGINKNFSLVMKIRPGITWVLVLDSWHYSVRGVPSGRIRKSSVRNVCV